MPRGVVSAQPGITMDLTATILAAAGIATPSGLRLEGRDLVPLLVRRGPPVERTLFWRIATAQRQQRAVRQGTWKLLLDGDDLLLFDVGADPGERHDVAASHPQVVRALHTALRDWESSVDSARANTQE